MFTVILKAVHLIQLTFDIALLIICHMNNREYAYQFIDPECVCLVYGLVW